MPTRDPTAPISSLLKRPAAPGLLLVNRGLDALLAGLAALNLAPEDEILLPAFLCSEVTDGLEQRQIRYRLYDIRPDFQVSPAELAARAGPRVRALVIIHYFGIPQPLAPVAAFCADRKIALIEDCAHALFTAERQTRLGQEGDFAVFSLWKFLPLPEGGALRINRAGLGQPHDSGAGFSEEARARLATLDLDALRAWRVSCGEQLLAQVRPLLLRGRDPDSAVFYGFPFLIDQKNPVTERLMAQRQPVWSWYLRPRRYDAAEFPVSELLYRHLICINTPHHLTQARLGEVIELARMLQREEIGFGLADRLLCTA